MRFRIKKLFSEIENNGKKAYRTDYVPQVITGIFPFRTVKNLRTIGSGVAKSVVAYDGDTIYLYKDIDECVDIITMYKCQYDYITRELKINPEINTKIITTNTSYIKVP